MGSKARQKWVTTFSYQNIGVDNYQCERKSILENTTSCIVLIKKQFSRLSEENSSNADLSGTPITGESILRDIF